MKFCVNAERLELVLWKSQRSENVKSGCSASQGILRVSYESVHVWCISVVK